MQFYAMHHERIDSFYDSIVPYAWCSTAPVVLLLLLRVLASQWTDSTNVAYYTIDFVLLMHRLCRACTFVYCLRELRCLKFQNQCRKHYRFLVMVLLTQFHKHRLQGNHYNKVLHVPLSKSHLHNQLEGSRHENVETSNSFCHCCRELHNLDL